MKCKLKKERKIKMKKGNKKPKKELRTEMILIRATESEKKQIEKLAVQDKRTVSNYVINKILSDVEK